MLLLLVQDFLDYTCINLKRSGIFCRKAFEKGKVLVGFGIGTDILEHVVIQKVFSYNYTFSEELFQEWTWSSRYPEQPEILAYLNYVADKFHLREDIQFNTTIKSAHYNEKTNRWDVYTDKISIYQLNILSRVLAVYQHQIYQRSKD